MLDRFHILADARNFQTRPWSMDAPRSCCTPNPIHTHTQKIPVSLGHRSPGLERGRGPLGGGGGWLRLIRGVFSYRVVEDFQVTCGLDDISACIHILLEEIIVHGDLDRRRFGLARVCGCCVGGSKVAAAVVVRFLFFITDPVRPGSARLHRYQQDKGFGSKRKAIGRTSN